MRRRDRPASARLVLPVVAVLLGSATACGGGSARWADLGQGAGDERRIHEVAARFVIAYWVSPAMLPPIGAWCIAAGRNALDAARLPVRQPDAPWVPSPRVIEALADVQPAAHPVHACAAEQGDQELLRPAGTPAALLAMSQPLWRGSDEAELAIVVRRSLQVADRFRCRIVRTLEAFEVRECL